MGGAYVGYDSGYYGYDSGYYDVPAYDTQAYDTQAYYGSPDYAGPSDGTCVLTRRLVQTYYGPAWQVVPVCYGY